MSESPLLAAIGRRPYGTCSCGWVIAACTTVWPKQAATASDGMKNVTSRAIIAGIADVRRTYRTFDLLGPPRNVPQPIVRFYGEREWWKRAAARIHSNFA